ncbi:MAG: Nif3-like dinuclear metal center hexameric protein [Raineya sp.]|jgi:dinuclear metal center YbgI/SA1388 family protein|nr:Nif3-like dinuclear metal center hexameric protein [Raineya sp.]
MDTIKQIIQLLESFAPPAYQESYDNSGLIVGNSDTQITGVLVSLDMTEDIVDEAINSNCNLIVAHHPILFKPLKSLTGKNYVERTILKAIKHDIALYAIHTNLDNVWGGVNFHIAERLGLRNVRILAPKSHILSKLTTFCPKGYSQKILEALWQAGAGQIGNYQNCSFQLEGTGTFQPNEKANPFLGEQGKLEEASEFRIEVVFPTYLQRKIIQTLKQNHPYEEVAYYLHNLENENQEVGSGAIGELSDEMDEQTFLMYLKEKMNLKVLKHTRLLKKPIKKVALCGGSGVFLLRTAIAAKADIFITADVKYHEFFDTENKIVLADIGHYESEIFTKELLHKVLSEKFPNIAVQISQTNTNPVYYL